MHGTSSTLPRRPRRRFPNNSFGGRPGGRLLKDKTFFFVDYEGQRENVGVVSEACVPTAAHIADAKMKVLNGGGSISPIGLQLLNFWPSNPANFIPGVVSNDSGCFDASGASTPDYTAIAPSFNNLS